MIETIIAMGMAVVVTGAAVLMLVSVLRQQPELTQRADQVSTVQNSVERLVREIRQGVVASPGLSTSTGSKLEFETYVDGRCGTATVSAATKCKVVYQCEKETCTRTSGTGTATATTTFAEHVKNAEPFSYLSGPSPCTTVSGESRTFISVTLELKSSRAAPTKIEDGAGLRSCS
jgi:hypothetical protein